MALALTLSSLNDDLKHIVKKTCIAKPSKTQYDDDPQPVSCFAVNIDEDTVYVPLGVWRNFLDEDNFPEMDHFTRTTVECKGDLYTLETDPKGTRDQNVVFKEAIARLEAEHTVFIAAHTGYGKTTCGTHFSSHFKLKTAVLSHLSVINEQWKEDFLKNTTAKVQIVQGKKGLDPIADVYIIGVQKAASLTREELSDVGLVIFDEAHIATITAFSKSLLRFQPKYVIGFSATPKRADGMHKLFTMYFGSPKSFIVREEVKNFTVYKVQTEFKPDVRYVMVKGVMVPDWNHIVNSIEYNEDRQKFIASLVLKHPDHRILILSCRQDQSRGIHDKLVATGEGVRLIIGETRKPKVEGAPKAKRAKAKKKISPGEPVEHIPRVTVAGTKKAGTGFNDPSLTMAIIASDCKNVAQWEGRIRTSNNIIYDLVDDYSTFENHWKIRMAWYIGRGATIEIINRRVGGGPPPVPTKRIMGPKK